MTITPLIAGLIILGIILGLFVIALIALQVSKKRSENFDKKSLPQGSDTSEFSTSMSRRFEAEDKL